MSHTIAALLVLSSTITGGLGAAGQAPVVSTAAATGPNLRACFDGRCKLTLSRPVSFRVSSRYGITRLSITFTRQVVRVKGTGPGVSSQATLGAGASGSVNGIGVRVVSLTGRKAALRLSPVH
ncbi:hypothetical protein ACIBG4_24845 [Nonomuraea sp. NPDC050383]|uniref:hypothetical protein n=1 Tax=Nonomuraea sp. NPDC050383 TaxID=3364362 RepID=UPI0037A8794A